MSAPHVVVVLAALAAAGAEASGDLAGQAPPRGALALAHPAPGSRVGDLVLGARPPGQEGIDALVLQALPPAPEKLVRTTRIFGTVTIDHRAHLARRASCKKCHDPGPVRKMTFTPKVAHGRCITCHQDEKRGPTACGGCHVKPSQEQQQVALAEAPAEKPADVAAPSAPGPDPRNVAAALAALDRAEKERAGRERPWRTAEIGLAAGSGWGATVRVTARHGRMVYAQAVDTLASDREARTLASLGAGVSVPLRRRVALEALAVGGFDAVRRPVAAFLPALGARAGVEIRCPWRFMRTVNLALTGIHDLSGPRAPAERVGGTNVYATLSTGLGP